MYHSKEKIYTNPDLEIISRLSVKPSELVKIVGNLKYDHTWYNTEIKTKFVKYNLDGSQVYQQTDNTIKFAPLTTYETIKVSQGDGEFEVQLKGQHKTNPGLFRYKSRYMITPYHDGSKMDMHVVFEGIVSWPIMKQLVKGFYKGVLEKAFDRLEENIQKGTYKEIFK